MTKESPLSEKIEYRGKWKEGKFRKEDVKQAVRKLEDKDNLILERIRMLYNDGLYRSEEQLMSIIVKIGTVCY